MGAFRVVEMELDGTQVETVPFILIKKTTFREFISAQVVNPLFLPGIADRGVPHRGVRRQRGAARPVRGARRPHRAQGHAALVRLRRRHVQGTLSLINYTH